MQHNGVTTRHWTFEGNDLEFYCCTVRDEEVEKMSQSFAVQEIILQRRKHIVRLEKTLAKTSTHDAIISLLKEIHDEQQSLEYFENSEAFN